MFRYGLAFVNIFLGLTCFSIHASDGNYGRIISIEHRSSQAVIDCAKDLSEHLGKITGKEFSISSNVEGKGILLRNVSSKDVPQEAVDKLQKLGKEAFLIRSFDNHLLLAANSELGLSHAVYTFLEELGCRWYFPTDTWTVLPKRTSITLNINRFDAPVFRMRTFSGTGGFGGKLPIDQQMKIQGQWAMWMRRNRLGGEYILSGHSGEAFNIKHKETLIANPEYLAMHHGRRDSWSPTVKLCPSNPKALALFTRDRIEAFSSSRKARPDDPRNFAVSVEPADGGGHCEAPESLAIGSISDRVFFIANAVSKELAREFPHSRVSLFAYNEHADVPSIPINPNVHVCIIPYGFQRTNYWPEELIVNWQKKVQSMSLYDYWSIPDWAHDMPSFNYLETPAKKIRFWHKHGVEGFLAESTYSSGAMGPGWLLASRLLWNPEADENKVLNDFYENAFGPARIPMKRLLERWSSHFELNVHELALSFRDLAESIRLSENYPVIKARILDYARYLQYLRMRHEYLNTKADSSQRITTGDNLLRYILRIYSSSMIHSFRDFQLLLRQESKSRPELLDLYKYTSPDVVKWWQGIHPVEDKEAGQFVNDGMRDFTPYSFENRSFVGSLVPLNKQIKMNSTDLGQPMTLLNSVEIDLQVPSDLKVLTFRVASPESSRTTLVNSKGQVLYSETISLGEAWKDSPKDFQFKIQEPGSYSLRIWSPKRTVRIQVPKNVPHTIRSFQNSQGWPSPRLWFYVPKGTNKLAISAPYTAAGPPRIFDPNGKEQFFKLEDGGKLLLLDIPDGFDGVPWSISHVKAPTIPIRLLNAPQGFSFSPESLLIPEDAKIFP